MKFISSLQFSIFWGLLVTLKGSLIKPHENFPTGCEKIGFLVMDPTMPPRFKDLTNYVKNPCLKLIYLNWKARNPLQQLLSEIDHRLKYVAFLYNDFGVTTDQRKEEIGRLLEKFGDEKIFFYRFTIETKKDPLIPKHPRTHKIINPQHLKDIKYRQKPASVVFIDPTLEIENIAQSIDDESRELGVKLKFFENFVHIFDNLRQFLPL